jgi:hypothetical protein
MQEGSIVRDKKELAVAIIALVTILIIIGFGIGTVRNYCQILKAEKAEIQQELQKTQQQLLDIQQQKAGYKEGKYTMITNLSSSMYLNRIPANFEKINPWTDVNGVSGFDVTINGTHYRYVEGHIELPQLHLYAPYMNVVSDSVWP